MSRALLLLLALALLAFAAADKPRRQRRQSYYQRPSPQAYYKRPRAPQSSQYRPQGAPRPRQAPAYFRPGPQLSLPPAYQPYQPLSVPPAYQPQPQYRPAPKPEGQDLSKVPGQAGVDYPIYHSVPDTKFHCGEVPAHPGIYANVDTGCQAYHVCHDGREGHQGASFLCPNGTIFNQHEFACDWWYNVNCADAPQLYSLNLDPLKNPYSPKPKKEDAPAGPEYYQP